MSSSILHSPRSNAQRQIHLRKYFRPNSDHASPTSPIPRTLTSLKNLTLWLCFNQLRSREWLKKLPPLGPESRSTNDSCSTVTTTKSKSSNSLKGVTGFKVKKTRTEKSFSKTKGPVNSSSMNSRKSRNDTSLSTSQPVKSTNWKKAGMTNSCLKFKNGKPDTTLQIKANPKSLKLSRKSCQISPRAIFHVKPKNSLTASKSKKKKCKK